MSDKCQENIDTINVLNNTEFGQCACSNFMPIFTEVLNYHGYIHKRLEDSGINIWISDNLIETGGKVQFTYENEDESSLYEFKHQFYFYDLFEFVHAICDNCGRYHGIWVRNQGCRPAVFADWRRVINEVEVLEHTCKYIMEKISMDKYTQSRKEEMIKDLTPLFDCLCYEDQSDE